MYGGGVGAEFTRFELRLQLYATASSAARAPWRGRFRFPSTLRRRAVAGPSTTRISRRAPTGWCSTKELAHDALLVLALLSAAPSHAVNMLTDEQQYSRHADAAVVQLCGRATRHCEVVWHSLRALISRPQLALSQPGSIQGLLFVCVVGCMSCAGQVQETTVYSEETPPLDQALQWQASRALFEADHHCNIYLLSLQNLKGFVVV